MSEETKTEQPTTNIDDGGKSSTTDLIDKASAVAERLENARLAAEKEANRWENLMAKALLGGRAHAGQEVKELTPDEIAQKKADEVLAKWYRKR